MAQFVTHIQPTLVEASHHHVPHHHSKEHHSKEHHSKDKEHHHKEHGKHDHRHDMSMCHELHYKEVQLHQTHHRDYPILPHTPTEHHHHHDIHEGEQLDHKRDSGQYVDSHGVPHTFQLHFVDSQGIYRDYHGHGIDVEGHVVEKEKDKERGHKEKKEHHGDKSPFKEEPVRPVPPQFIDLHGENKHSSDGNTTFLRAARNGQLDKVLEYLKSNIDINTSNANGLNALHLASKDGHVDIVKELLKRGALVDSATKKGNTALHIASLAGQEEVVKLLVQNKASVNVQSQNGFTPLYMAAQENHDNVVRFLLANGANQTLATEDGFTPLAVAMQQGHDKVVAVLLENDTKGKIRLPALHIAAKKDDVKAAKLLLENEHNPDVTSKSGFTPLHIASHYGNQQVANLLIQKGADVNYAAKHNITPLHVAAKWGKTNMVALLLECGASIESKTRDGLTPLHCAARSGHEQVVDMLVEGRAPISCKTKNGLAPLHMAAQGDHVDAARILLYHRAPVDEVTVDYLTALHVAAHCGHVRVAKLLLDRQADANARALNGFTPLHIACKKNRIKVVELLLKHGASIGATTESGLTPLHVASFMGCMNIVIYLLQHEASSDVPTIRGETPLHLAARASQTDIIRILLRNGAQVDARARELQTPLHIASRLGNVDMVMLLLQHGASVDSTTKDNYTALHIAAKEGRDEVVGVLIDNGASLTATTKKGFTPLHLAAKNGHLGIARVLLAKEAPVDPQGKNGVTPLHVASHYDHQDVALLLLDKGASPHATAKNGHTPLHIAARKNQMDIANTLLEYGAKPNAESKAGFTPLHLSAQEGHSDMTALLVEHKADTNHQAKNGLTPLHLCAQEDRVPVAEILVKNGAEVNAATKCGYKPLHIACHYGQINMVRFLLSNGASVASTNTLGYTPLHQAAQQGHTNIINVLLENNADPNALTESGQTPLNIAQKLNYITVIETLKVVTTTTTTTTTSTTNLEEKYRVVAPEAMQETFMSDSEEEGGEDTGLGDQTYRYLTADEMKSLGDDSLPIDVTRDERIDTNRLVYCIDNGMLPTERIEENITPETIAKSYVEFLRKNTDNVDIGTRHPINIGFLVSFLVDARGGAMRGCRHSGVRVIVPPRCAPSPTRITCRYVRPQRTPHPPPLMEGEALASRVLELGPVGAKFLGPVIIEVPHFAALRGKEREIVILRSDNGESWKEHTVDASEEILNEVLHDSFDSEDLNQMEDMSSGRITRILTQDFPQYFAVVSRVRQEVHAIGPEGGMVSSTVVPQVQAVFPEGALTKKIKVGLQAQPIDPELTAKLLGHGVAVSPVVTVEPRRRKFHKSITLSMPAPRAHSQGMINQYSGSAPTLRLLCSITGGTTRAQWEDVTGSTPLSFVNDCVSFTTTVSARFWLMDCRNIGDATKMATELYKEAIHVPFMAKFVVFAKRVDPLEARLRVFCMTDDKEDKTLEHQEHFTEVAKSRDVEVLEGKPQYIEFAGNLVPVTKSGEQLQFSFRAFRENRLPFSVRVKDQHAEAVSRCLFMKESKVPKGEPPQQPICILNIVLPDDIVTDTISLSDSDSIKRHMYLSENFDYYRPDPRLADMSNLLGEDWVPLANQLGLTPSEINVIKSEYPDSVAKQAQSMLRMWLSQSGNKAQTNSLENALRRIGREDIIPQCLNVDHSDRAITRIKQEEIGKYRLKIGDDVPDQKDKYSAEEKAVEVSDEEDFNKTVTERRQQIEERLSAERTIPASSQRVEIVQEITTIKRQSLVEDKLAEVQKVVETQPKTTKKVSETVIVKTTPTVAETDEFEEGKIHRTADETELYQGVAQRFDGAKRPIPKLIADEEPKSPSFAKTPPPSPADFLLREQAAINQELDASRRIIEPESAKGPAATTVDQHTVPEGKPTTTTQYLARTEEKPVGVTPTGLSIDQSNLFANLPVVTEQTNALIQSESRAEPFDPLTAQHYKIHREVDDETKVEPSKDEKKAKKGFLGTLKTFVGKSLDHSDSDSEKSSKKEKKPKKDKKKKRKHDQDLPPEVPVRPPRKPKLPTPTEERKFADIPYVEASPNDAPPPYQPPEAPQVSFNNIDQVPLAPITDLDADLEVPVEIKEQATEIIKDVINDGETVASGILKKSPKKERKTKVTIVEEITKTFEPLVIEEEKFSIRIDPTKKESPKKSREIFTLNLDESIDKLEKEILEKSPILSEEKIVKPVVDPNSPTRPPRGIKDHVYEDIGEPLLSSPPEHFLPSSDEIKKSTTDLIQNELNFSAWADDKHNVCNQPKEETKEKITDSQKLKRKHNKLFGLFGKGSKDTEESDDDSSKAEIIEKQDREILKEKKVEEPKKDGGFLGLFGKKSKKEDVKDTMEVEASKPVVSEEVMKNMEDTTAFLQIELTNYEDGKPVKVEQETKVEHILEKEEKPTKVKKGKKEAKVSVEEADEEPKKQGFLGLFKKSKTQSEDEPELKPKKDEVKPATLSELSSEVLKHMEDSKEFLNTEVTNYEDAKPIFIEEIKVEVTEKVGKSPKLKKGKKDVDVSADEVVDEPKKQGFLGLFKKSKTQSEDEAEIKVKKEEITAKPIQLPEELIKDMEDTTEFLKTEVQKYEDVKPATVAETKIVETEIIEKSPKLKKGKKEVDSEGEEPKKQGFLGLFKKSKPQSDDEGEVKAKKPDSKSTKPVVLSDETVKDMKETTEFLKTELVHYEDEKPVIIEDLKQQVELISEKPPKGKKDKPVEEQIVQEPKKQGFLGLFKKSKTDSDDEGETKPKKDKSKPAKQPIALSEEVLKHMKDSTDFLHTEVVNYEDVKPVKEDIQIKQVKEKVEKSPKTKKGKKDRAASEEVDEPKKQGFLGLFKKSKTVDDDAQVKSPPSEEHVKNVQQTTSFLLDEVDRYHDVRPIVEETVKFDTIIEPESVHVVNADLVKPKESEEALQLTESALISMIATTNFIQEEVAHYHDVRPIVKPEEIPEKVDKDEEKLSKSSGLFGLFTKKKSQERELPTEPEPKESKKVTKEKKRSKSKESDQPKVETETKVEVTTKEVVETEGDTEIPAEKSGGFLGLFSKKPKKDKEEKSKKELEPSEELQRNIADCNNFIGTEVSEYHDVRPVVPVAQEILQEVFEPEPKETKKLAKEKKRSKSKESDQPKVIETETKVEVTSKEVEAEGDTEIPAEKSGGFLGLFSKKPKKDKEEKPKKDFVPSEELQRNITDCNNFIGTEVSEYHDVRPVVSVEKKIIQEVVEPEPKETKKLAKEKKRSKSKESDKPKVETETKTEVVTKEVVEPEGDTEIPAEKSGGFLGLFSKKPKKDKEEKSKKEIDPSKELQRNISDCNNFIGTEVSVYHDVRPVIPVEKETVDEVQTAPTDAKVLQTVVKATEIKVKDLVDGVVVAEETKLVVEKQQETLQSVILKDISKLDEDIDKELERLREEAKSLVMETVEDAPKDISLPEETIKAMSDTSNFLQEEVRNYEDAKPELKEQPPLEKDTKEKKSGIFGFFGKRRSQEREMSEERTVVKEDSVDLEGKPSKKEERRKSGSPFRIFTKKTKSEDEVKKLELSEDVLQQMIDSGNFLSQEIEHFEDVKPPVDVEPEVKLRADKDKKDDKQEKTEKRRSGGFFSMFSKSTDPEGTEAKPKVEEPLVLSEEVTKQMQETQQFLSTEVDNYEDTKPILVTDLDKDVDEDEDIKSTGLFGIFSKKDKKDQSPKTTKKKYKKHKRDKSLEDTEKIGFIEKIGRKLTSSASEAKEQIEDVTDKMKEEIDEENAQFEAEIDDKIKETTNATDDIIDTTQEVVKTVKQGAQQKQVAFKDGKDEIIETTDKKVKVVIKNVQDIEIGAKEKAIDAEKQLKETVAETEVEVKDVAVEAKVEVDKASKKAGGFFSKLGEKFTGKTEEIKDDIKTSEKQLEKTAGEVVAKTEDTVDKAAKKTGGFFSKLGEKIGGKVDDSREAAKSTKEQIQDETQPIIGELNIAIEKKGDEAQIAVKDIKQHTKDTADSLARDVADVTDDVKEAAGKAEKDVQKKAKKGGAFLSKLTGKLSGKTEEIKEDAKATKAALDSKVVDVKDTVSKDLEAVADDIDDKTKEIKDDSSNFVDEMMQDFEQHLEHVKDKTEGIEKDVVDKKQAVKETTQEVEKDALKKADSFRQTVDEKFSDTMKLTEEIAKKIEEKALSAKSSFDDTLEKSTQDVVDIKESLKGTKHDIIDKSHKSLMEKSKGIADLKQAAEGTVSKTVEETKVIARDFKENVEDTTQELKKDAEDKIEDAKKLTSQKVQSVKDSAAEVKRETEGKIEDAKEFAADTLATAGEIKTAVADEVKSAVESTADKIDTAKDSAKDLTKSVVEKSDRALKDVEDYSSKKAQETKEIIVGKTEEAKQVAKDNIQAAGDKMQSVTDAAKEKNESSKHAAEEKIKSTKEAAKDLKEAVEEKGAKVVKSAEDQIYAVGEKIESAKDDAKEKFEITKDAAKEQIETTKDAAKDLKIAVEEKGAKVVKSAEDKIHTAGEKLYSAMEATKEKIETTKDAAKDLKTDIEEKGAKVVKSAEDQIHAAGEKIDSAKETVKEKLEATKDDVEEKIESTKDAAKELKSAIEDKANQAVKSTEDQIHDAKETIKDKTEVVKASIVGAVEDTKEAADEAKTKLVVKAEEVSKAVAETADQAKHSVEDTATKTKETIKDKAEGLKETTEQTAKKTGGFFSKLGDKISKKSKDTSEKLEETLTEAKDKTKEAVKDTEITIQKGADKTAEVLKDSKDATVKASGEVKDFAVSQAEGIKEGTEKAAKKTGGFFTKLGDKITGKTKEKSEELQSKTEEIKTTAKETKEVLDDTKDKLTQECVETVEAVKAKGQSVQEGIESDISKAEKALEDTAKQIKDKEGDLRKEADKLAKDSKDELDKELESAKELFDKKLEDLKSGIDRSVEQSEKLMEEAKEDIASDLSKLDEDGKKIIEEIDVKVGEGLKDIEEKAEPKKSKSLLGKIGRKLSLGKGDDAKPKKKDEGKLEEDGEKKSKKGGGFLGKLGGKLSGKAEEIKQETKDEVVATKQETKEQLETAKEKPTVVVGDAEKTVEEVLEITVETVQDLGKTTREIMKDTTVFIENEMRESAPSTLTTDDFGKMTRTVSDMGNIKDTGVDTSKRISEANIDLSTLPTNLDEYHPQLIKSTKTESKSYVTSPTLARRTASQRLSTSDRPEVMEVRIGGVDDLSDEEAYIVTEPEEYKPVDVSRKPLFHIESEDLDDGSDLSVKLEKRPSVQSNVLESLSEHKLDHLLSDLTKNLEQDIAEASTTDSPTVKQEVQKLEEHKKEAQAEVDLIEQKLRDLDVALDSLEQLDSEVDANKEKRLRRVERKFERMASEVMDKEAEEVKLTTPEVEEKREHEFQRLVSQLSTEEVSDFQKEYSHLWDENTFSKTDEWGSKTPDSQADVQELPQGGEAAGEADATTSSTRTEEAHEAHSTTSQRVTDQHQLSDEMRELLKELEKESKQ